MSVSVPSGAGCNYPWQIPEVYGMDYDAALATIQPGWFIDCKHQPDLFAKYNNYYGHVWQCDMQWYEAAIPDIQANQDRLWFFGNEPNVDGQAVVTPKECADTLNQVRKDFPKLVIAAPGVFHGPSTGGWRWVNAFRDAGGPDPDYWTYDSYQPNADMVYMYDDIWKEQVGDTIPSIVKEAGCWLDRRGRITTVMDAFRHLHETKAIHAWAWFSARYEADFPYLSLLQRDGSTTWVGKFYRQTISAAGATYNTYLPNVTKG